MRIAIPIANGSLCAHFGHCEHFAVLDVDDKGAVISSREEIPPPHEPGVLPSWLKSLGVEHVIAGGMGSRAQGLFFEYGITVTVGVSDQPPEVLAREYVCGKLENGDNICDH